MSDEQEHDPRGPSLETLERLRGMLPQMAKGIAEKKLYGKGNKALYTGPSKFCQVCEVQFAPMVRPPKQPLLASFCDRCRALLEDGYTAFRFGDKFAIVKHPKLKELGRDGKVVPVHSKAQFDEIERIFKDTHGPESTPPEAAK